MVAASKDRRPNRSPEEVVAELEAKIASVRARAQRRALNADAGRKQARLGLAALRRAIKTTEDAALRFELEAIVSQIERCVSATPEPSAPTPPSGRKPRSRPSESAS